MGYLKVLLISLVPAILLSKCGMGGRTMEVAQVLDIDSCGATVGQNTLDILTWNLFRFPSKNDTTIDNLAALINELDADIIVMQEISEEAGLMQLAQECPGWGYQYIEMSDLNLAFFYKENEVTVTDPIAAILEDDPYAFPRPPLKITLRHQSGLEVILINIHLKCCGSPEDEYRRRAAAEKLKMYMDINYPNEPLILAGDFNDDISGMPDNENVFLNLVNDSENYTFADLPLAERGAQYWSYPFWPSHLDHFLITDELFDSVISVETLAFDQCDFRYFDFISDHRPVMLRLIAQ